MSTQIAHALPHVLVHPEGHYLVTEHGEPFFWLADTGWELFHRLTYEETAHYFKNRAEKGFNVILAVALAEFSGLTQPNVYGDLPFVDLDPRQPNAAYWQHVDAVIALAAEHGLYIGLLPTWGDKVAQIWGEGPEIFDVVSAGDYGEWIGRRYRDASNVLWIIGGDRPPQNEQHDWRPIWRALADGVRRGVDGPCFMSFHPNGGLSNATSQTLPGEAWLDMNMVQSGHGSGHDTPVWESITRDFLQQPAKPTLDAEPNYEDHPVNPWPAWNSALGYYRDDDVRRQCYRSVFAGGCGVTYGHHAVWQFFSPRLPVVNHADRYWWEAIDRPGAAHMLHLHQLMISRPYFSRIPAEELLVSPNGMGGEHLAATRDAAGSYAFVYFPDAVRSATLDLTGIGGKQVRTWWYDTHTGIAHDGGVIDKGAAVAFVTPVEWHDWVLVIDDAGAHYPPPGQVPDATTHENWKRLNFIGPRP